MHKFFLKTPVFLLEKHMLLLERCVPFYPKCTCFFGKSMMYLVTGFPRLRPPPFAPSSLRAFHPSPLRAFHPRPRLRLRLRPLPPIAALHWGLFTLRPSVSVVDNIFDMDNLQNDWNGEEKIGMYFCFKSYL
jgi:hypothetical protein